MITSLLVGNLVLLLVSVKLSGKEKEPEIMAVEYSEDLLEEEVAINITETVKVETNTAYNEAERFIEEIENSRNEEIKEAEENGEESESLEENSFSEDFALNDAKDKLDKVKEKLSEEAKKRKKKVDASASNRKTTISYHLEDRKAMQLRNPVYTCDSRGKVVINIEVNSLGKVVKASYNKAASTTSNGCLIDNALSYARRAKFTTKAGKPKQVGTITYNFQG
ncbi:MAG: hypothetical protein AAFP76_01210 [Bacteroidota bacterium]